MITEDYVSFETAKLLKEKGFEGDTSCYFVPDSSKRWIYQHYHDFDKKDRIECPTLQMAMKWLREKHNIFLSIQQHLDMSYVWYIYKNGISKGCDRESHNNSYEQACEAAIKYCLENLI